MKRSLSSIGLHSFQGIRDLPQMPSCVNHVSGTFCKLSVDNYIPCGRTGPGPETPSLRGFGTFPTPFANAPGYLLYPAELP